ncbi:hypothetical protein TYRP_019747 [Tyrophagus putrescentiae]|nr:hypothetical protein TYRP_019747 [Tyrophagus putrescentiae]
MLVLVLVQERRLLNRRPFRLIKRLKHLPRLRSSIVEFERQSSLTALSPLDSTPSPSSVCSISSSSVIVEEGSTTSSAFAPSSSATSLSADGGQTVTTTTTERFIVQLKSVLCTECLLRRETSCQLPEQIQQEEQQEEHRTSGDVSTAKAKTQTSSELYVIKLNLFRRGRNLLLVLQWHKSPQPVTYFLQQGQQITSSSSSSSSSEQTKSCPVTAPVADTDLDVQFSLDQLFEQLEIVPQSSSSSLIVCILNFILACSTTSANKRRRGGENQQQFFCEGELVKERANVLVSLCAGRHSHDLTFAFAPVVDSTGSPEKPFPVTMVAEEGGTTAVVSSGGGGGNAPNRLILLRPHSESAAAQGGATGGVPAPPTSPSAVNGTGSVNGLIKRCSSMEELTYRSRNGLAANGKPVTATSTKWNTADEWSHAAEPTITTVTLANLGYHPHDHDRHFTTGALSEQHRQEARQVASVDGICETLESSSGASMMMSGDNSTTVPVLSPPSPQPPSSSVLASQRRLQQQQQPLSSISDSEMPKPDTVKTVKRLFESPNGSGEGTATTTMLVSPTPTPTTTTSSSLSSPVKSSPSDNV